MSVGAGMFVVKPRGVWRDCAIANVGYTRLRTNSSFCVRLSLDVSRLLHGHLKEDQGRQRGVTDHGSLCRINIGKRWAPVIARIQLVSQCKF
jgi:hypothetical protein